MSMCNQTTAMYIHRTILKPETDWKYKPDKRGQAWLYVWEGGEGGREREP